MEVNGRGVYNSGYVSCKCSCCGKPTRFSRDLMRIAGLSLEDVDFIAICPSCDEEKQAIEKETARKEMLANISGIKLSPFKISEENKNNSFSNFIVREERIKGVYESAKAFVDDDRDAFILLGKNGNGKTHLGISWLREECIAHNDCSPGYHTEYEIYSDILDTISTKEKVSSVIERYSAYDYLVIDELGKSKASEFTQQVFQQIVANRLSDKKKTFIIGNVDQEAFIEYFTAANVSRMSANGSMYITAYDDYRKMEKNR